MDKTKATEILRCMTEMQTGTVGTTGATLTTNAGVATVPTATGPGIAHE
jgi:hypothetical protein